MTSRGGQAAGLHPDVAARLARLAPDQRNAATAPPGPILCVAPAGSGKTTTLVARVAWLLAAGHATVDSVTAITFNKRAAEELAERLAAALEPLGLDGSIVRVRTFHALGREILVDAGQSVEPLVDRMAMLRRVVTDADSGELRRLDTLLSRLKLDLGATAADVEADPEAGPVARTFAAYERAIEAAGGLDFDDLVARALRRLQADAALLERWRERCRNLLVDEVQDLDRAQLRMALLLAAPANQIFLVGDDDQSIYGWRLADVRRVIGLAQELPGLRRIDLEVNYRCPRPVVERAVRLVEHNRERFAKRIVARDPAPGRIVLAPDAADEPVRLARVVDSWPDDDGSRAILARTNRELLPAISVALDRRLPFRPPPIELLVRSRSVDAVLAEARSLGAGLPLLVRLETIRRRWASEPPGTAAERPDDIDGAAGPLEIAPAVVAWAAPFASLDDLAAAIDARRQAIDELCRDDARLTFATAHATKGLEFDHVAVVGMEAGRFPSHRSVAEAAEPQRSLEEERRLAYVAWTRARRSLTLLYDPAVPSRFLSEAFSADELASTAERR